MDDRFMTGLRREPRAEFARDLRARLRAAEDAAEAAAARPARLRPALALAAVLVAVTLLFMLPSVRASAQAFLDLFRVRNFAAVPVDPARLQALENQKLDLKALLADRVETLKEPGEPRAFGSVDAAGAAAGIDAREPATLPEGMTREKVQVRGDAAARITIDTSRLRSVLETLELRDLEVPAGIDGKVVEVRVPPVVVQSFRKGQREVELMQSRSPEVTLPPGADLTKLGEIGLRIVGLSAEEARRFASSIDWTSTLLVPVPAGAGSFRQVEVNGARGLMVTVDHSRRAKNPRPGEDTVLLWTQGEQVFALCGNISEVDLLQMANSLR